MPKETTTKKLTPKKALEKAIPIYGERKEQFDVLKKDVDAGNAEIKKLFNQLDISSLEVGGFVATVTTSDRVKFDEDLLLARVKELCANDPEAMATLVKTREYVDSDALESALYHETLDAAKLADCQIITPVVTLKVKRVK